MSTKPLKILCISRFFKGEDFLRACKALGIEVYLLTSTQLKDDPWPREAIDEFFLMEEDARGNWNMEHVLNGLAYTMRSRKFDICVALDDFDVENTAHIREHFRIPGMGDTTARYFRDKLAMRMKAEEEGISIPAFTPLFNDSEIYAFTQAVPGPWVIKPRTAASARGIKKLADANALWAELDQLGDQRHHYLLEKFAPGDVFHVDSLNLDGKVLFARVSQYLDTPFEVAHEGGIFRSVTTPFGSEDEKTLLKMNEEVMKGFGMKHGASHTEFIKCHEDGKYYFLETSSRVGGANLAEMVEASSGINLWAEWANIEMAIINKTSYTLPKVRNEYSGIVVSLSRFQRPDTTSFTDAEIVWRMEKDWHIGMILRSTDREHILGLLDGYTARIAREYHASLPAEAAP